MTATHIGTPTASEGAMPSKPHPRMIPIRDPGSKILCSRGGISCSAKIFPCSVT